MAAIPVFCDKCGLLFNSDFHIGQNTSNNVFRNCISGCPNPKCDYFVKSSWDVCPECLTPIKKEQN